MSVMKNKFRYAGLLALSISLAAPALGQDRDTISDRKVTRAAEIVVTARKTPELLSRVPLSITSVSAETINDAGLDEVSDLFAFAPNVDISGGIAAQLQGQISIRGISTLVRNIGLETGVGLYVDGVYAGRPGAFTQNLFDVERVEIARGPQGTEYGKNTIAGVIHVYTPEPDDVPSGYAQLEFGNYDHVSAQGALGGPLGDGISARGAISYVNRDGFYRHLSDGKDAGSADTLGWRMAVKAQPSDDLTILLRADGLRDRGVPAFFQADQLAGFPPEFPANEPRHIDNNRPNRLSRDIYGVSLTADWEIGNATLTSITAFRDSSYEASLDDDQTQIDFVAADDFGDDSKFVSSELRLAGTSNWLNYLAGAYYFDQSIETDRKLALGADLGVPGEPALTTRGRVDSESFGLFGRLDVEPTDRLLVSAGLRYTHERKQVGFQQGDESGIFTLLGFPNLLFEDQSNDNDVSPTVSASYELADGINAYVRFSQGFKSAGYNVDISSSLEGLSARSEKATSYEAGLKTLLLDDRLRVNLAVFHTDYDRLQVSQVLGSGIALTNAGQARTRGAEFEFSLDVLSGLKLEGNAALLDAEYARFPNCGVPALAGGGVTDCSGNNLVLAPEFTGHAAVQYETTVGIYDILARFDVDHRSTVFFEPTNQPAFAGEARTLLNARVGFGHDWWKAIAWIRNITDDTSRTYADDRSAIGVLRTAAYGAPRTFGVTLRARY